MSKIIVIFLISLVALVHSAPPVADDLIVELPDGKVEGTAYVTANNVTFYGFRGIPYATPPLGDLRFESPQPPKPWTGIWNATADSKYCISILYFAQPELESEDCLYVNVYIPAHKAEEKLPVMFWIYGGGFVQGNSAKSVYGPDYLIEENIIMVSFNYRLGSFGFLSTGDKVLPGNYGLKDQNLALKWTKRNIEYFGGDPEKITIFGESAGGGSSGLHLVSRLSAGLFRAAIVQSGAALSVWAVEQDPKTKAYSVANAIHGGDYGDDTQALKDFMKNRTVEEIAKVAVYLGPTIEVESTDAFLTEAPYQLLESGNFNQVPIIIGVCAEESLMFLYNLSYAEAFAKSYDDDPETLIPENLYPNSTDRNLVVQEIKNIYLKKEQSFLSNLAGFAQYYSDNLITRGVIKQAELASSYVPVYFYQFSYYGRPLTEIFIDGVEKASHAAELPFLFNIELVNESGDAEDMLTQNRMVKLWTNFARYLDPIPEKLEILEDITWPSFNGTTFSYLNINSTLGVLKNIKGNSYPKWVEIYETYGKKPFVTF